MIWFTSDPHIFHANVIKYCNRPFSTVEEMNEALVYNWNSVVLPDDTVYCLGDFSMAARPVETFTPRLLGRKHLVPGNHDFLHSYHKKSRNPENRKKWIAFYESFGWTILPEQTTLDIPGFSTFNLCHHPYTAPNLEEGDDKYANWRPVDDGKILLCGHVHASWKSKKSSKGTLMVNVGVDVWDMRPVSLEELKAYIGQQEP